MSKAQLHGIVGYTGFIRPSLQCTQLSALKPGKHAERCGSYQPRPPEPEKQPAVGKRMVSHPGSMMQSQADFMEVDDYNNFERKDRAILEHSRAVMDRESPTTAHWQSMHTSQFTEKSPDPHLTSTHRPERQPILPSPKSPTMEALSPGIRCFKDLSGEPKKVLGAKQKPSICSVSSAGEAEKMDMSMTWPRKGSREQLIQRPASHVLAQRHGTTKDAAHPPGYMGFIPHRTAGERAWEHGSCKQVRASQRCKEDTLFDSFPEKPAGYRGYAPTSVYNRRTWEIPTSTTNGASNAAMQAMNHTPCRPAAGGTATLLDDMFSGPLDGRPSDNGVFNSQVYYKLVRPLEGACRSFVPSKTHHTGRKFMNPSITMKNF